MKRLFISLLTLSVALAGCRNQVAENAEVQPPQSAPELSAQEQAKFREMAKQVLFWSDEERSRHFRAMEDVFPGTTAKATNPRALEQGAPLTGLDAQIDTFMAETGVAGLMMLKDGKIVLERYGLGLGAEDRWTSFSVAKSFTSTLVGAAVKDGLIASLDDPVTKYIPDLAGGAYDDVNVRQLLTMTSGVRWNEDYTDPESDVVQMSAQESVRGENPLVSYMKALPREAAPGEKWVYKTGETNLIGLLVANATGRQMSDYAEEKITGPAGFAGDMFWMTDLSGDNLGGCCLSLRLADYARMGQWVMSGAQPSVPEDWTAEATATAANVGRPGYGYGYQWWTYPEEAYGAQGIFGQAITIVPERNIVIAMVSNWETATGLRNRQIDMFGKMIAAVE
ncbi:MAG: serine hydrolase domain-containing protein [Pacificimonas sp.]